MKAFLGFLLWIVAWAIQPLAMVINFLLVRHKYYFIDSAISLDRFANREYRTLWNTIFITKDGYKFGNIEETISAVLGHNIIKGTLSIGGKIIVFLLSEKHCTSAINH